MDNNKISSQLLQKEKNFLNAIQRLSQVIPEVEGSFKIPSITVIAPQSAGKSSLVDALININNFSDTGEGTKTRVPVQLQLQTDENVRNDVVITRVGITNPRIQTISECKESMKKINEIIEKQDPPFEGIDNMLQYNIRSEFCHNLTVIDTPGLRTADYQDEVEAIIRELLEQLTDSFVLVLLSPEEDWDNASPARQLIESNPDFKKRAVLVRTKLSLKLQQLGDENEVTNFFSCCKDSWEGWLSPPFFVDCGERIEIVRQNSHQNLSRLLEKVDKENLDRISRFVKEPLLSKVKEQLGVAKLRAFLQLRLTEKLTSGGSGFLSVINKKISKTKEEKQEAEKQLNGIDGAALFKQLIHLKTSWWNAWKLLLQGIAKVGILEEFGMTIADERSVKDGFGLYIDARSNPLEPDTVNVLAADYKLVGGPQLKRTIAEFYEIATLITAESSNTHAVLSTLQPGTIFNSVEIMNACAQIVCEKARIELKPLIKQLVERCSSVMMRIPDVCAKVVKEEADSKDLSLQSIEPFWQWLSQVANEFITSTTIRCLEATKYDFWGATEYIETEDDYVVKEELAIVKAEVDQQRPPDADKRRIEEWAIGAASKIVPLLFRVLATNFFKTVKRKLHVFFLLSFEERAPEPEFSFISFLDIKFHELRVEDIFKLDDIKQELENKINYSTSKLEELVELQKHFQSLKNM